MNKRWMRSLGFAMLVALIGLVGGLRLMQAAEEQSSRLSVKEHGLGTAVVDRKLVGKGESFPEGTDVWFWTRVAGGKAGDRVHHVWIHEGKEVVTVGLSVGGPHWRTYSRKRMHPGSVGEWKAEIRDQDGSVLASAKFACTLAAAEGEDDPAPQ